MSSMGSDSSMPDMSFLGGSGAGSVDPNSYNFSSGLGNIDPNSGLNSLNAGLIGPGAGTMPNGYVDTSTNYVPDGSGVSTGALNGDTSFTMPSNSTGQLSAQSLGNALGQGAKIANSGATNNNRMSGGPGRVAMHQVTFANPIQDFGGSNGGSAAGNSLLQLLAKYHPGASQ